MSRLELNSRVSKFVITAGEKVLISPGAKRAMPGSCESIKRLLYIVIILFLSGSVRVIKAQVQFLLLAFTISRNLIATVELLLRHPLVLCLGYPFCMYKCFFYGIVIP